MTAHLERNECLEWEMSRVDGRGDLAGSLVKRGLTTGPSTATQSELVGYTATGRTNGFGRH